MAEHMRNLPTVHDKCSEEFKIIMCMWIGLGENCLCKIKSDKRRTHELVNHSTITCFSFLIRKF